MGERLKAPQPKEQQVRSPLALKIGVVLSIFWAAIVLLYGLTASKPAGTKFVEFWNSSPDAFGNALAGIFAPLAFLWLVIATLLQRDELVQNREALYLQAKELANAVEQSTQQTKYAGLNRDDSHRADAERKLTSKIETLAKYCADSFEKISVFVVPPNNATEAVVKFFYKTHLRERLDSLRAQKDWDAVLQLTHSEVKRFTKAVTDQQSEVNRLFKSKSHADLVDAIQQAKSILDLNAQSPDSVVDGRIRIIKLDQMHTDMTTLNRLLDDYPVRT